MQGSPGWGGRSGPPQAADFCSIYPGLAGGCQLWWSGAGRGPESSPCITPGGHPASRTQAEKTLENPCSRRPPLGVEGARPTAVDVTFCRPWQGSWDIPDLLGCAR